MSTHEEIGFAEWEAEVDRRVQRKYGVSLFDLPDLCTRDAYDAGSSPTSFVIEDVAALIAEEFGSGVFDD